MAATPTQNQVPTVLSQLPDSSFPSFDFLDSSFFSNPDDASPRPELPSPQQVHEASGARMGHPGVWHFQELGVLVKFRNHTIVHIEEALAPRFINKMFPTSQIPTPEVFAWKSIGDVGHDRRPLRR